MNVTAHKVLDNGIFVKVLGSAASAPAGTVETPRTPIHLITVIDTSGSMLADNRLFNVKNSLQYMLPYMSSDDMFSLVSFSDFSRVACQNVILTADGKRQVEGHIHSLNALGSTNMGSALIAVSDIIATTPAGHTTCVLILTDGEVTTGITNPEDLINLVQTIRSSRTNTTVYSVGYGSHHNFSLMRSFAHEGSGSYSVVENLEHVATVFGDILGGLLSIVAQNCEILLPNEVEVITKLRVTTDAMGKKVHLGNLYDGSQQSLIVRDLPVQADGSRTVTYRYFDSSTRSIITTHAVVSIESGVEVNNEAQAFMLRIESADLMSRIANFTITAEMLQNILPRLRAIEHVPWVPGTIAEFERVVRTLIENPRVPVSFALRSVTGAAANNAAVLSSARGVTMSSQAYDPSDPSVGPSVAIDSVFSTPMQRHVSRGISGAATQAVSHTGMTPAIRSMSVGGGAGAFPTTGGVLPSAGSLAHLLTSRFVASPLSPIPSIDEGSSLRPLPVAVPPFNPSSFADIPVPPVFVPRHSGAGPDDDELSQHPPSNMMDEDDGSDPVEPSQPSIPLSGFSTPPRRASYTSTMRHSPPRHTH